MKPQYTLLLTIIIITCFSVCGQVEQDDNLETKVNLQGVKIVELDSVRKVQAVEIDELRNHWQPVDRRILYNLLARVDKLTRPDTLTWDLYPGPADYLTLYRDGVEFARIPVDVNEWRIAHVWTLTATKDNREGKADSVEVK